MKKTPTTQTERDEPGASSHAAPSGGKKSEFAKRMQIVLDAQELTHCGSAQISQPVRILPSAKYAWQFTIRCDEDPRRTIIGVHVNQLIEKLREALAISPSVNEQRVDASSPVARDEQPS